jgi:hypothetical protein
MVYLSAAGAREPGFSPKALSGHGHLVMAVEGAIGSFHSRHVRSARWRSMPARPASGINAAFGIFVFGAFAEPFRPAAGWVAAVGSTRAPWPIKGLAGQFWRMNETG